MKIWDMKFDLARLLENSAIACMAGGFVAFIMEPEKAQYSAGIMGGGFITLIISAVIYRVGDNQKKFVEDTAEIDDLRKKSKNK